MELLSKYKFAAVAVLSGLVIAVTLSLTYGDNFQASTLRGASPEQILEQANASVEKDSAAFEDAFSAATTNKVKKTLLNKTANKFQKYCRYFKLAKIEFECGSFVSDLISGVKKTVKKNKLDSAKTAVDDAFTEIGDQFNQ